MMFKRFLASFKETSCFANEREYSGKLKLDADLVDLIE